MDTSFFTVKNSLPDNESLHKAIDKDYSSDISIHIKDIISTAKVFAEGRGFSFEVRNNDFIEDIKSLIEFKLSS